MFGPRLRAALAACTALWQLSGCGQAPQRAPGGRLLVPATDHARLTVRVGFAARQLMAPVSNWKKGDITRLELKLIGGASTITQDLSQAEVATNPSFTFENLKAFTTYTLEARAYHDPDGAGAQPEQLISATPANGSWQTTIDVQADNAPAPAANVSLQLVDVSFDGQAQLAGIAVTAGGCLSTFQGVVTTLAGTGTNDADGASGIGARFQSPAALVRAADGSLFVADEGQHVIKRITPSSRLVRIVAGQLSTPGSAVGPFGVAQLNAPAGLALTSDSKTLYVADSGNHRVLKIDLTSADYTGLPAMGSDTSYVSVVAGAESDGSPLSGTADGTRFGAQFQGPRGVVVADNGDVIVLDTGNHTVRRIDQASADPVNDGAYVTTIAGVAGTTGATDGDGASARFNKPCQLVRTNADEFLLTDFANMAVRRLRKTAGIWNVTTMIDQAGLADDPSSETLFGPTGIAWDGTRAWVMDYDPNDVQVFLHAYDPNKASGDDDRFVNWVQGLGQAFYRDGAKADANFDNPGQAPFKAYGVVTDAIGRVHFTDAVGGGVRTLQ